MTRFIDFSSKPPTPAFQDGAGHMAHYEQVYDSTKSATRKPDQAADAALAAYLDTYERLGARHVILRGRDLRSSFGTHVSNESVAAFCREHGPRFIGFAGVDPARGMAAVRDLEHAVRELGMKGLNLPCFELKIAINDARLYPLYAKCIELDIPVALHCGVNFAPQAPIRNSHPMLLDEVMVHFPELRVLAGPPGWPWINDLIAVAWRHANVHIGLMAVRPRYLDVPNSGYESLLQYGSTVLKDRIIVGSAFPLMSVEQALADVEALPLSEPIRQKWLHDNAARFLRLDD
ncbi:MAG: amidohydrolase family protein [Burkholderiaceae bacterium]